MITGFKRLVTSMAAMAITGCVAIPKDRGAMEIQSLVDARSTANVQWSTQASSCDDALPLESLSADAAVTIGLRCSPKLQALYAELALTQADIYEATRLSNPQLEFARLATGGPDDIVKTTWSISQRFVELLMLPSLQSVGREQWLAAQQRTAHAVLQLERDVRAAYVGAVSAAAIAEMQTRAALAAELSAKTAAAFHAAGNISELQLSRERAAAMEARLDEGKAVSDAARARSEFFIAMGVAPRDPDAVTMPVALPLPSALNMDADSLRHWAHTQRLDVQAAQLHVVALDKRASQQKWWRWFGNAEIGFEHESETREPTRSGPTASIGLPIFNTRKDVPLRAAGRLELAQADLRRIEIELDNEVPAALQRVRLAREATQLLREHLMPLRERVTALSQREFNYMFIGAFELLAVKREELQAYRHYLEAVRDEWLAQIQVQRIAGGSLPENAMIDTTKGVQP